MALVTHLPLKVPKSCDLGRALTEHLQQRFHPRPVPPPALAFAREVHETRAQLERVESLTDLTAEDATAQYVRQENKLARLQSRFDQRGLVLGLKFRWREAWKPRAKAEQGDLEWERACLLFDAGAALSYSAARAQARGARDGGLKEAVNKFQQAALALSLAYDIVKPAIWGLTPRWGPKEIGVDMSLELLGALKELMLAQAQRAFYEKAALEGLKDAVVAKLAAAAADGFVSALREINKRPEVVEHLEEKGGLFSAADRSFVARIEAAERAMAALAQQHAAKAAAEEYDYGNQVARLAAGALAASEAAAAAKDLKGDDKRYCDELTAKLNAEHAHAHRENENIYREPVPPAAALPPLEAKKVVKLADALPFATTSPSARSSGREEDPLAGLLPASLAASLAQHTAAVDALLHKLSAQASEDTAATQRRLQQLHLPHALDACSTDKVLPEALLAKIREVKAGGATAADLDARLADAWSKQATADQKAEMIDTLLKIEDTADAELIGKNPQLTLAALPSSARLGRCRADLADDQERLKQAEKITKGLADRFASARDDVASLDPDEETLVAGLPHLDGTPLEEEPCVPALRTLLESLEGMKGDAAATLAAAQAQRADEEATGSLAAALVNRPDGVSADAHAAATLASAMGVYAAVESSMAEAHARREALLDEVATQQQLFMAAQSEAGNYAARKEYLGQLENGAAEALAVKSGLEQGENFYTGILRRIEQQLVDVAQVNEAREGERKGAVDAHEAEKKRKEEEEKRRAEEAARPRPVAAAASSAPLLVDCHQCKRRFTAPPGAAVVACAHCGAHNRVAQPTAAARPAPAPAPPAPAPAPVVATPMPAAQTNSGPITVTCSNCRTQFHAPPGHPVVGCPRCKTHNHVPGGGATPARPVTAPAPTPAQNQPARMRCAHPGCGKVFAYPPGAEIVGCPHCGGRNRVPT